MPAVAGDTKEYPMFFHLMDTALVAVQTVCLFFLLVCPFLAAGAER